MPTGTTKMICPKCGTPMNHHANKLIDPVSERDAADMDTQLGGVVEETHACPRCGNVEFRRARPA
jgi:ribosomal protein S27AE